MSSFVTSLDPPEAPSGSEEAAPVDGWRNGGLAELRSELDRIDTAIHDLLIQRAGVVEHVARAGKPAAFRPGREASIIRRLLGRHHGALPPSAIVRIWREMLAGTTGMQGGLSVAVGDAEPISLLGQLAKEHFGALTPLRAYGSAGQAMTEVSQGHASVAILPFPSERDSWWVHLMHHEPRLYIIAQLPFWKPRPEGSADIQALVVGPAPPDASGLDRSFLGLECDPDVSRTRLAAEFATAGLKPERMVLQRQHGSPIAHALVEVDGYLTDEMARMIDTGSALRRPMALGGYAMPVGSP